jgi:hypothetical protein
MQQLEPSDGDRTHRISVVTSRSAAHRVLACARVERVAVLSWSRTRASMVFRLRPGDEVWVTWEDVDRGREITLCVTPTSCSPGPGHRRSR